ncbi:MAG: polyphosphate kinase 2 family protein, partial [Rhodoglobus sp.]
MSTLSPATADFDLSAVDTSSTPGVKGRKVAEKELEKNRAELGMVQERLYADSTAGGKRSVLLVLQAMDTAGKGGIIRHVVGQVDPQGVHLHAFKAPTDEEKKHDFLWRVRNELPTPGRIGVFDRSHYEDVLIHRVHGYSAPDVIEARYGQIVDFEKEVVASG